MNKLQLITNKFNIQKNKFYNNYKERLNKIKKLNMYIKLFNKNILEVK